MNRGIDDGFFLRHSRSLQAGIHASDQAPRPAGRGCPPKDCGHDDVGTARGSWGRPRLFYLTGEVTVDEERRAVIDVNIARPNSALLHWFQYLQRLNGYSHADRLASVLWGGAP